MQFDGVDVTRFKYLMWTLVSRAGDPKMSSLVQHTAKKASFEERMAIVKGINYIAEPCVRVLDFRMYFYELCQAHEFEGIQHFMDGESIQIFNALIEKTGGKYTLGVYDELNNYAKKKAAEFQQTQSHVRVKIDPKFIPLNRYDDFQLRQHSASHDVSKHDVPKELLIRSIEQRVFEEHYINNSAGLSHLLAGPSLNYRPLTEFITDSNQELWQYLQMEQDFGLIHAIIHKPEIKAVLAQSQAVSKYYLVKKLNVNDQLDFAMVEFSTMPAICHSDPELFACLQLDDVKLLRLDILNIEASDLIKRPSLLRSKNNVRLQSINAEPSEQIKKLAESGQKLITITDESNVLHELKLLSPHVEKSANPDALPNSLVQYLVRPRQRPTKLYQAVLNSQEYRKEDRFACNTTCILIKKKSKKAYLGRTINMSTKGLAVKFDENVELNAHDEVFINLPSVNKRMSAQVKNQPYSVISNEHNQVRLKISGSADQRQGEKLMVRFLAKFHSQLKTSGKTESLVGLTQSLRSLTASCHQSIPFSYVIDKRSSFIEFISTNVHSQISNLIESKQKNDVARLVASDAFVDYIKHLYIKMMESQGEVYGYVLLLPRYKEKSGKEHSFWLQDLVELAEKQTGYEFISKLQGVAEPSVLAIRLCKPKKLSDRYFADELNHLNCIDPIASDSIPDSESDIVAFGEIKEISDLFISFNKQKEDVIMIDAPVT